MKKVLFSLMALASFVQANAQCTNGIQSPTSTVAIQHICATQTLNTGTGRFAVLSLLGTSSGDQYRFTSNVATDFLTVRDNTGAVLAFGTSPLTFTQPAIVKSTIQVHTNSSNTCTNTALSRTISTLLLNNCPPAPSNDECVTAGVITVNNDNTCTNNMAGTTVNATQSQVGCNGTADDDVWYSFVATASTNKVVISVGAVGDVLNPVVQIFQGSCAGLSSLACNAEIVNNKNTIVQNGLTVGTTYFIRVYSQSNRFTDWGTFSICVTTPNLTNDDCSGALPITINNNNTCTHFVTSSTTDASQTLPGCSGIADDDVWFSFVATASSHKINITPATTGGIQFPEVEVFSGNCSSLVSLTCLGDFTPNINFIQNGLTTGTTYFIRVYSSQSTYGDRGAFTICINSLNIPANDECNAAVSLPVNSGTNCASAITGTTVDATQSRPGCSGTADDDVWYSFVATSVVHKINVSIPATGGIQSPVAELFTGTCASLTSLNCRSAVNAGGLIQGGLTIGATYFVRIYSSANTTSAQGSFTICVTTPNVVNDECSSAIALTPSSSNTCNTPITGTTIDASQSQVACTGTADDDVWYSFVATANKHKIIVTPTGATPLGSPVIELFTGNCTSLTSLACKTIDPLVQNNLVIGNTYFVRVYSFSNGFATGTFTICVTTVFDLPNEECSGAIALTVNPSTTCTVSTASTTIDASQSLPGCSGSADDDVWFSFVATNTSQILSVIGTIQSPVVQLFTGNCGNLTSFTCNPPSLLNENIFTQSGLTVGTNYYVRVYSSSSSPSAQGNFNICISSIFPPNDNCSGAIPVTVNAAGNCTASVNSTTLNATQSMAPCSGTVAKDVWFSFVANSPSQKITVNSSFQQNVIQLFDGTCSALSSLTCQNTASTTNTLVQTGLTTGSTYYVRVFKHSNSASADGTFTICINDASPPGNNDCSAAQSLTINNTNSCTTVTTGSTVNATQSIPGCAGNADDDVWYSFVATATAHKITVMPTTLGGIIDQVVELFSGNCSALTSLTCSTIPPVTGTSNIFIQSGLTIGTTYFIRVYSFGTAVTGTFTICVSTPFVANDNCSSAITLPVSNTNVCSMQTVGTSIDASQSMPGCTGTADDDVWYKFVATAAVHLVDITTSGFSGIQAPVIEIFTGTCSGLVSLTCINSAEAIAENLTIGNTYFIRVYSFDNSISSTGAFEICITTPLPGTHCNVAFSLTPSANEIPSFINGTTSINNMMNINSVCKSASTDNVFYKFTVTNTHNIIRIKPTDALSNIYTTVLRGSCTGLSTAICSSKDTAIALTDLLVGEQITLLLHSNANTNGNNFEIAVTTNPITNDECVGAIPLPIGANSSTASYFNITSGATQSLPACSSGVINANDVWFSFTTSDSIAIEIDHLNINNIGTQLFTGICGALSPVSCNTVDNIIIIPNSLPNQTYYLRLYSLTNDAIAYFIKAYLKEAIQKNNLFSPTCLFAPQNSNPGFEIYDVCPTSFVSTATAGGTLIPGWSFPTKGTSDYYNSCSNFNSTIEVPGNNCDGKQSPRTGNGYIGLFAYTPSGYREYIQGNLQTPLVPGKRYIVSYYVNLADISKFGINKLGLYFSTTQVAENIVTNLSFLPQLTSAGSQFFTNKHDWVNVSHIFTADQAYQFFTIGNFATNANTTIVATPNDTLLLNQASGCISSNNASFVKIDDVTVSEINESASPSCASTLPLTLTDFDVLKQGAVARLAWKTVYEINTKHFEIERSINGINFIKLGIVQSNINTGNAVTNYQFIDANPQIGYNYYRLKMVDADGKFTYTDTRRLLFDGITEIMFYPNPVKDVLTISGLKVNALLQLFSLDGKMLKEEVVTSQRNTLDMSRYAKGMYFLLYKHDGEVISQKIVKQ